MPEGDVSVSATPDVSTPSTDVSSAVASSTPAKIDYSKVSDEDIRTGEYSKPDVSTAEESSSDAEETTEETAEVETKESEPVVKDVDKVVPPETEEEEEIQEPEPDNLKRAFKTHPELRDAYYRDKKFREVIGSVKEAREYKELYGTVQDAKTAMTHAQALLNLDRLYVTDPGELLTRLNTGNANAFENLMASSREMFHHLNPQGYRQHVAEPIINDFLENAKEAAAESEDENFTAAIEILSNRMGLGEKEAKSKQAPPPYDPRLKKLEEYERRDADQYRNALFSFGAAVDHGVTEGIKAEIDATFNRLPANGLLPGVKAVVAQQLVADVVQALEANTYLTNIFNSQKIGGELTDAHLKALVTSRLAQAKPLIGKRVAGMLKKLTADTLATNQQALRQGEQASQRKEVGTGSGQSVAPVKTGKIDYRRTSNEDIRLGRITYKS